MSLPISHRFIALFSVLLLAACTQVGVNTLPPATALPTVVLPSTVESTPTATPTLPPDETATAVVATTTMVAFALEHTAAAQDAVTARAIQQATATAVRETVVTQRATAFAAPLPPQTTSVQIPLEDSSAIQNTRVYGRANTRIDNLFFLDAANGWAIVTKDAYGQKNKLVLRTWSGGASWRAVSAFAEGLQLDGIYFRDQNEGWLYGNGLYHTIDGGFTWVVQRSNRIIRKMAFIDGTLWISEQDCRLDKICDYDIGFSTDHGASWQSFYQANANENHPIFGGNTLTSVRYIEMANYKRFRRSDDLGRTWSEFPLPCLGRIRITPGNTQELWLLCSDPAGMGFEPKELHRSDDGGMSWTLTGDSVGLGRGVINNMPLCGYVYGFTVLSSQRLFIGSSRGWPIMSVDGGKTWTCVKCELAKNRPTDDFCCFAFSNSQVGWTRSLYTDWAMLTSDGGATWRSFRVTDQPEEIIVWI